MLTVFVLLIVVGGVVRLALEWQLKKHWGVTIGVPHALAGALVVLAGLPEMLRPFSFPMPLGLTIGLLLPDLLLRRS